MTLGQCAPSSAPAGQRKAATFLPSCTSTLYAPTALLVSMTSHATSRFPSSSSISLRDNTVRRGLWSPSTRGKVIRQRTRRVWHMLRRETSTWRENGRYGGSPPQRVVIFEGAPKITIPPRGRTCHGIFASIQRDMPHLLGGTTDLPVPRITRSGGGLVTSKMARHSDGSWDGRATCARSDDLPHRNMGPSTTRSLHEGY